MVVGLGIAAVVPVAVVASGAIDARASADEDVLDWLGHTMFERSVARRAPDATSPVTDRRAAEARGYEQYVAMCVQCHGAPGVPPAEFAEGISPRPPRLDERAPTRSDGELFHIIQSGVRMTAMPSFGVNHEDREIWDIVAFLRVLHGVTEEQRRELAAATRTHDRGHGDGHGTETEHARADGHAHDEHAGAAKPEDAPDGHAARHEHEPPGRRVDEGDHGRGRARHAHARGGLQSERGRIRDRASEGPTDPSARGTVVTPEASPDRATPAGPEPCATLVRTLGLGTCDANGVWRRSAPI